MRLGEFDIAEPVPLLRDPHMLAVLRPGSTWATWGVCPWAGLNGTCAARNWAGCTGRAGSTISRGIAPFLLVNGNREVTIPNTIIRYSNPVVGPHLLTVHLLEPHLYGEDYSDALLEVIEYFGVKQYALIGGMYDMVPHTRPLVVSGLGTGPNTQRDYGIANARPSSYEGPTTITYTISETATKMGLETRAFVVHLPQYLNLDDDYQGAARMMDILCRLYDLPDYITQTERGQKQYDELTSKDGQLPSSDALSRMEDLYDSEYGESRPEPSTPLPSSIEEFLQGLSVDLGDGGDPGDGDTRDNDNGDTRDNNDRDDGPMPV